MANTFQLDRTDNTEWSDCEALHPRLGEGGELGNVCHVCVPIQLNLVITRGSLEAVLGTILITRSGHERPSSPASHLQGI